jgi:hypothetical protein
MKHKVLEAILSTANDIGSYLEDDTVPLECHEGDVGRKLQVLHDEVRELLVDD